MSSHLASAPSSGVHPTAPPPWVLSGNAHLFAYRFPPGYLKSCGFAPEGFPAGFGDDVGALIYADYEESPVGPYRELALVAGWGEAAGRRALTVPKMYVSSAASAALGRSHWGLPKQEAEFQVLESPEGLKRVVVLRGGVAEVDLTMAPAGRLPLPAPAFLLPPAFRTLVQRGETGLLSTRLSGSGVVRRARLLDFRSVPYLFPSVLPGRQLAGFEALSFRLRVPAPERLP